MGDTIQLKGLASVEHATGKGSFTAYTPERPVPTPIKEGDRLHVRLQGADKAWVYAVAAEKQEEFWQMGAWKPGEGVKDGVRILWPGGHILTAQEAEMTTMFVIASTEELPWARDLKTEDTSALVGKMPPDPPKTAADHLYGLFWKVPGRVRGMQPPPVEYFWVDDKNKLPAIVTSQTGSPYAAVEWLFKPRQ